MDCDNYGYGPEVEVPDSCCNCGRELMIQDGMEWIDETQVACGKACMREYLMTEEEYALAMAQLGEA